MRQNVSIKKSLLLFLYHIKKRLRAVSRKKIPESECFQGFFIVMILLRRFNEVMVLSGNLIQIKPVLLRAYGEIRFYPILIRDCPFLIREFFYPGR